MDEVGSAENIVDAQVDFEAILRQRVASDRDQNWGFLQGTDLVGAVLFRQELHREREALFGVDTVAAE